MQRIAQLSIGFWTLLYLHLLWRNGGNDASGDAHGANESWKTARQRCNLLFSHFFVYPETLLFVHTTLYSFFGERTTVDPLRENGLDDTLFSWPGKKCTCGTSSNVHTHTDTNDRKRKETKKTNSQRTRDRLSSSSSSSCSLFFAAMSFFFLHSCDDYNGGYVRR